MRPKCSSAAVHNSASLHWLEDGSASDGAAEGGVGDGLAALAFVFAGALGADHVVVFTHSLAPEPRDPFMVVE